MKTLYLLRHAKSSWDDDEARDVDRPLNRRGKRDCVLVAKELQRSKRSIQHVYCSTAKRTRATLKHIIAECDCFDDANIHYDDALYTFDTQELLTWLKELDNSLSHVMIIGHSPALGELCNYLYEGQIEHFGTCTFAELEIKVEFWDQLRTDSAKLVDIIRPKQLR